MTRSKRRQNRATLAVDLAELDAIINALVHDWGGDLDPGLLAYLNAKRENLRKRVRAQASSTDNEGEAMSVTQDDPVTRSTASGLSGQFIPAELDALITTAVKLWQRAGLDDFGPDLNLTSEQAVALSKAQAIAAADWDLPEPEETAS